MDIAPKTGPITGETTVTKHLTRISAALAGTMAALSSAPSAAETPITLEIAVYHGRDAALVMPLRNSAQSAGAEADGLLWWRTGIGADGAWLDIRAWDRAAQPLPESDALTAYLDSLGDPVFEGLMLAAPMAGSDLASLLTEGPLIEVALYRVADVEVHRKVHPTLYDLLPERTGTLGGARLVSDSDEDVYGDLLIWPDATAWETAGRTMMAEESLAPFFNGVGETFVFQLFEPN